MKKYHDIISIDREVVNIYASILWCCLAILSVLVASGLVLVVMISVITYGILRARKEILKERPNHKRIRR
jgi:hypothetical protein